QRIAVAVLGVAGGDAHPALTHAILLDIGLFDALEADADIAGQDIRIVVRAVRIDRQAGRQFVMAGFVVLAHSKASIAVFSPSGRAVGAWRATTPPDRSTRNLVKFHLIDGPSRPDFSRFRYSYNGCAFVPFTSILANIGNVT